jgi:outer membrane lipoprotein-sorting protein
LPAEIRRCAATPAMSRESDMAGDAQAGGGGYLKRMITRRTLLAALPAALVARPVLAAPLSLAELSAYLNTLQSVKAQFTQIADDGTISTGTIYIKRPGRVRFEYDPPNNALVMAGGGQVAIFDPKSNVPPEQYPLRRTPLNLILEREVDLARRDMVVGHRSDGATTTVIAQDPENPEYGTIELVFSGPPAELRQWVITNGDGTKTTVILGALEEQPSLSALLFSIPQEIESRNR